MRPLPSWQSIAAEISYTHQQPEAVMEEGPCTISKLKWTQSSRLHVCQIIPLLTATVMDTVGMPCILLSCARMKCERRTAAFYPRSYWYVVDDLHSHSNTTRDVHLISAQQADKSEYTDQDGASRSCRRGLRKIKPRAATGVFVHTS